MKIKLVIYLLTASSMSPLQAFRVINKTSEIIIASGFGYIRNHLKTTTLIPAIEVGPGKMTDTRQWANQSFCRVTITAKEENYSFYELYDGTEIVFAEDEHGHTIYTINDWKLK